jgi:hypothetical protein
VLGPWFVAGAAQLADAMDEWMELGSLPMHFELDPSLRELLGPGRTR